MGSIFVDTHTHAPYALYNRAYLAGLIFVVSQLSVKTAKKLDLLKISHYMVRTCTCKCISSQHSPQSMCVGGGEAWFGRGNHCIC